MAFQNKTVDEDLVKAAQQGSMEAFSLLYDRYLPFVYKRVCFSVPWQDSEDVTQEIFMAVIRSLKGFRGNSLFRTWLRTLVNRQIAEYYRRRPMPSSKLEENMVMENNSTSAEDAIVLKQALRQLPTNYQEILLLRFADGLKFHEIAKERGCSLEACKSLFRRALSTLHDKVKRDAQPCE